MEPIKSKRIKRITSLKGFLSEVDMADSSCPGNYETCPDGQACPDRLVCRCLQITEKFVIEAVGMLGLETVQDVRQFTSAGNGWTACHAELQKLLLRQQAYSASSSPICSVK